MPESQKITIDGNEAAARVAYALSEIIAIYPITPSSPMGEQADVWASRDVPNIWGVTPDVVEMQSEGGAAGAVHGALSAGALTTTFTASQGLLLMLPNMFKIAGELTPAVFHVAARSIAAQALSIFGDHSDVMATRSSGFGMLASGSVQEVMDLALVAHAASLESRLPFLHFFDGFRTSHELMKISEVTREQIERVVRTEAALAHRDRGLRPEAPSLRGTAQNPDVFFQARESVNSFYNEAPAIVQSAMDRVGDVTGRHYRLFDYVGAPDAESVIVLMGSGAQTAIEAVEHLVAAGEKVGLVNVRLYRPFSPSHLLEAIPGSARHVAVLDRTKEPGSAGEPLYQDVATSLMEGAARGAWKGALPRVVGGRYGLSSKEFTPAMVKAVFDGGQRGDLDHGFTVGINDDLTHTSISVPSGFRSEDPRTVRAVFVGLGSDGTVSANKNSIKIIGERTDLNAQGYFVYDSKKAGAVTVSHLRFSPAPIRSTYLIDQASFVACHQWGFIERRDVLKYAADGATVLLNSPYGPNEVWAELPQEFQQTMLEKKLKLFVIDGYAVAGAAGMGRRINTVMQTCFFAISGVLEREEALTAIREAIKKTYGGRGANVVERNIAAVDAALSHLEPVEVPNEVSGDKRMAAVVRPGAPDFVQNVTAMMMDGRGDELPVSALPVDGTYPTGTTQWDRRNLALDIPIWDEEICIQCNKCTLVCPHAAIRAKVYDPALLKEAPEGFKGVAYRGKEHPGLHYTLQVAPEDCTGCAICVEVCPAKNKSEARLKAINMEPQPPLRERERGWYDFFLDLPEVDRTTVKLGTVKGSQLLQPLFEYSGACSGCGETPYLKLATQLFGERMLVANATGCSSIFGGNLPTTPWSKTKDGLGPAWSNSLFEDNAEFGLGFRLTTDKLTVEAHSLLTSLRGELGADVVDPIASADQNDESTIHEQRERVGQLKEALAGLESKQAKRLLTVADYLVKKSIWIVGGDGWAYDIGYGGLDHVLASGRNVNILVLDTEVYSNTGGQASKATPRGAVAKFAAAGKDSAKKDLGMLAMAYGDVYVAQVAMGANDAQTVKAFLEAESYPGVSLIIAYSHCIAHGIDMRTANDQHKAAVECGHWPLYRFDPRVDGKHLHLDSRAPKRRFEDYAYKEARYQILTQSMPDRGAELMQKAKQDATSRWETLHHMANLESPSTEG